MNFNLLRILSTDGLEQNGIKLLRDSGLEVVEDKMSKTQLIENLPNFDAIIIRSATTLDAEIIRAVAAKDGNRLRIIARAGTGVDNIDMDAATQSGMIVMNTPAANTLSAAEHTFAMLCCLSRKVPQAYSTMQQGKWDRKSFMGTELYGKTLGIIGLGRIGREVASRAQAFGMKTIGYDPIVSAEDAASFKVESMTLKQIWPISDYITVHVPLIPQTENLINLEVFKQCKPGSQVINCSRGGIINESDLLTALNNGLCRGAALDVFTEEPPTCHDLIKHPNVISTPHLGASTKEAQFRVAMEIAENLVAVSNRSSFNGLVNGHIVNMLHNKETDSWQLLLSVLSKGIKLPGRVELLYDDVTQFSKQRGFEDFLRGSLTILLLKDSKDVNLINYDIFAKQHALNITITKRATNNPLNAPSLGIKIRGLLLEMSVWKSNVYLTKYNNGDLDQPILLKKNSNLLITSNSKVPFQVLANKDSVVSSYNVNNGVHILVTDAPLDTNVSCGFEFAVSF